MGVMSLTQYSQYFSVSKYLLVILDMKNFPMFIIMYRQIEPVRFFWQGFLKSERVARMVQSGGCSSSDFRDVFKKNIERRVRSLPEIDGLSKETVLSSWITKYDAIYKGEEDQRRPQGRMPFSAVSELILSKEQLYEMFQQILGIKKFEHQLLYNALQVSSSWVLRVCKVFFSFRKYWMV